MKKALIPILIFSLAGCAPAEVVKPRAASQDDLERLRPVVECAKHNIARIDDGISDASTVAFALASSCAQEYAEWVERTCEKENFGPTSCNIFRRESQSKDGKVSMFVQVVMRYRNEVKGP